MSRASDPSVSIAIAAWRRDHLHDAIASALDQGDRVLEVVITDDGDCEDIVSAFADDRIAYVRNDQPLGVAGNARHALNRCRGDYLCLLGDDDLLLPKFLDRTSTVLDADVEVGVVFTNYYLLENDRLLSRGVNFKSGRHDDYLLTFLTRPRVGLSWSLFRRVVWGGGEGRHPMPADVAPDVFIFARAAEEGWSFYYVDSPLAAYRIHPQMASRSGAYRDAPIATWEAFRFDDAECERQRLRLLAEAYVARGAEAVREGRARAGRKDLSAAKKLDPRSLRRYRRAYAFLAAVPILMRPADRLKQLVRRVRPGVEFSSVDRENPLTYADVGIGARQPSAPDSTRG